MMLTAGTKLGVYEILAPIGKGGMGEVYSAQDTKLGRDVAIKILPAEVAQTPERLKRFKREAQLLASLNHPHIASICGLEESEGQPFLVLELVDGEDLSERLKRGPFPVDEAFEIGRQVAEALEEAHEKGIVHRDLKPANIKVTPDGKVKVLDFGLAKAFVADPSEGTSSDLSQSPTLTRGATAAGVILGTAAYMSPEQAKGKPVDRRADIWSFGVVLFETLTGKSLYSGETASETLASVIKEEPDWSRLPNETPSRIRQLLHRCLEKDSRQRLQAIGEARIAIAHPEEKTTAVTERPRSKGMRLLPWILAAVFFTVAVVAGLVLVRGSSREETVIRAEIVPPPGTKFSTLAGGFPSLSPDGSRLVFVSFDEGGTQRLYVRAVDEVDARVLPGGENGQYPFWSPDSQWLGFFADGKLKKVAVVGGAVQIVCEEASGIGGTWNRAGDIVFAAGNVGPLYHVSEEGGVSIPITELDESRGDNSHRHPYFLPDGRHFLYLARNNTGEENNVVLVGSLDGGESKMLLHSASAVSYASRRLFFVREGNLLAQPFDLKRFALSGVATPIANDVSVWSSAAYAVFTVSRSGLLAYHSGGTEFPVSLDWVDRNGKSLGALGDNNWGPSVFLSPDEQRVAVEIMTNGITDLWVYEVARQGRARLTHTAGVDEYAAVWSPDGNSVVFSRGQTALYKKEVDGSGAEELLLESDVAVFPSSWSSDGKFIAFSRGRIVGRKGVWILPLGGDRQPYAFVDTGAVEGNGVFSPDGRWMAYESNESGQVEVYVLSFPTAGQRSQVSEGGGSFPLWRGDGSEIIYQRRNGHVMAAAVDGRGDEFTVGKSTLLFGSSSKDSGRRFAVTRDAQRFLVFKTDEFENTNPLTLVVNRTAELER